MTPNYRVSAAVALIDEAIVACVDILRLILDVTVVRVRLDRRATNTSLLVVLGVCRDGQKVLFAVNNMGGESEAAWRGILNGLIARGLRTPGFLTTDGAAGLERALAALWPDVPAQRCTVGLLKKSSVSDSLDPAMMWGWCAMLDSKPRDQARQLHNAHYPLGEATIR